MLLGDVVVKSCADRVVQLTCCESLTFFDYDVATRKAGTAWEGAVLCIVYGQCARKCIIVGDPG